MVGGYTAEKVALRRAIALGHQRRRGDPGRPARPGDPGAVDRAARRLRATTPTSRSEMGDFDPAKAKALLDLYGYVDRDGDGWREQPDGAPLVLEYATQPDASPPAASTQWQKNMDAIGMRIVFKTAQWPENLKASRAGKLMMWGVGWSGGPDGEDLPRPRRRPGEGPGQPCALRPAGVQPAVRAPARCCPTAPSAMAVMTRMKEILVAYMPYKAHVHRIWTDLAQPWVVGYHRNVFVREFWRYVDIDTAEQARRTS